ncbi:MAG TPA: hypothetical protein VFK89_02870 [Actinomycetota bacterium]|nr:hypothetical protein [Actinomycetota bacterium]
MVNEQKLLRIYLNDHSGGAFLGIELAKRCLDSNRGTELGDYLEGFIDEVRSDRDALIDAIEACGFSPDRLKQIGGVIAERAGRLKLNGQLTGYSPLSRLLELEGLILGVTGKLMLWRSLKEVVSEHPGVGVVDLDRMIARAEEQLANLEKHHHTAARTALTESGS